MRVQVPKKAGLARFLFGHPIGKAFLILTILSCLGGLIVFTTFYTHYAAIVDKRLAAGPFLSTSKLFAAPQIITTGEQITVAEIVRDLRRAGYNETENNPIGWYHVRPEGIEVFPGPESFFRADSGVIKIQDGKVQQIILLADNTERASYNLEPQLITNLFDRNREKRRIVHFRDMPELVVHAVVSVEDKRFFSHSGIDGLRVLKAAYTDVRAGKKEQGASTLSQQLARGFFLDREKTWKRKMIELVITLHLEQKLTKEQIFEYYVNSVSLGRKGSFSIQGFGEAAQSYFGKDLKDVSIPEAAMLAGLIQRPSYFNPYKWPERVRSRRNLVLSLMRDNDYITERQYQESINAPLKLQSQGNDSSEAPYFVDLVNDWLSQHYADVDFQNESYRVYTTLDLDLQREAYEAVKIGMQQVDELVRKRKGGQQGDMPQVCLIALDPVTGGVKALVGGRDYNTSQVNHASSKRPPGSVFKPFVYAAALNTALDASDKEVFTPVSILKDEPTTFWFDNKPYEPRDFHNDFLGPITLRTALAKSKNIPTVQLAQAVGYRKVLDLAAHAGLTMDVLPTPAIALGSHGVTPLEIAGAYSMFANNGTALSASLVRTVWDSAGHVTNIDPAMRRTVLDPKVNYLMVNLMEEVLRTGTGASVRGKGFLLPAAGKTGTSHDGWFAGFTSRLLCVVWVGYDDYRELNLEGAKSALPIWTEFMKRASQYASYRNVKAFEAPEGIVSVDIDPDTGELATAACPRTKVEFFLSGTQPVQVCHLHGGGTQVSGWDSVQTSQASPTHGEPTAHGNTPPEAGSEEGQPTTPPAPSRQRKGIFGRLRDIFK